MRICIVGLKPENGIPSVIIYALEGEYALEPPPGLEGYVCARERMLGIGPLGWMRKPANRSTLKMHRLRMNAHMVYKMR